jgi:energy-converting hydrogenase Eha subunit C
LTTLLPLVFTSGWASGVNAYATVLLLGLIGRIGSVDAVPAGLQRTDVLVAAAILYVVEFVADKIPYVDSTWDAVHTAIRPTIGTVIGLLAGGDATSLDQAVLAATGGFTALASHLVKSGLRLAINTSPEPASNIGVSLLEDFSVAGIIALAVAAPWVAAAIAAVLLAAGITLVVLLASRIRRARERWRARRA